MQEQALFNNTFIHQQPLIVRLWAEFKESSQEFRQNPRGYFTAAFRDDSLGSSRRKELLRFGMAVGVLVFSTVFFAFVILPQLTKNAEANEPQQDEMKLHARVIDVDDEVPVDMPKQDTRAGGGGG